MISFCTLHRSYFLLTIHPALGIFSILGERHVADIVLKCVACGRENKVSEYASPETLVCASCHHALEMPEPENKSGKLQMRRLEGQQAETLTGEARDNADEEKIRSESAVASAAVLGDVHKAREKVNRPHAFWSYLTFLLACGTLVGLQYMLKQRPDLMETYEWARIGFSAIGSILLLVVAFQDSTFQGLLCLFFLPYAIYYAAVRLEIYWIQGIFMGVIIALCAELYFMPNQAFITQAQINTEIFIKDVETAYRQHERKARDVGSKCSGETSLR